MFTQIGIKSIGKDVRVTAFDGKKFCYFFIFCFRRPQWRTNSIFLCWSNVNDGNTVSANCDEFVTMATVNVGAAHKITANQWKIYLLRLLWSNGEKRHFCMWLYRLLSNWFCFEVFVVRTIHTSICRSHFQHFSLFFNWDWATSLNLLRRGVILSNWFYSINCVVCQIKRNKWPYSLIRL